MRRITVTGTSRRGWKVPTDASRRQGHIHDAGKARTVVAGNSGIRTKPESIYEQITEVINCRRRSSRPRHFGPRGREKRREEDVAVTIGEHVEESGHSGVERQGQVVHERSRERRDDGSRDGQDGPAEGQE